MDPWTPRAELQNGSVFAHRQVIGILALKCLGSGLLPPNRTRSHLRQCLHRQKREVSKQSARVVEHLVLFLPSALSLTRNVLRSVFTLSPRTRSLPHSIHP